MKKEHIICPRKKVELLYEIERMVKEDNLTIETACAEFGISRSTYYNYTAKRKISKNDSLLAEALRDNRLIGNKYEKGPEAFGIALILCQLFPYLGFRSLLEIANDVPSWGNKKVTFHELYMFLTRKGLGKEQERINFSKRMHCPNENCKTEYSFLPSDGYSRSELLSDPIAREELSFIIDSSTNKFTVGECQNKENCLSKPPDYLKYPELEHAFSNYNKFLKKRFFGWASRQDRKTRLELKKRYPEQLKNLNI